MKVELTGLNDVLRNLNRIGHNVDSELNKSIAAATIETESKSKQRSPVDTGRLRSSISSDIRDKQGEVTVNVNYGMYMEVGTGSNVDFSYIDDPEVRRKTRLAANQFRGNGRRNINIMGYHYLLPSFLEAKTHLFRRIRNILR